MGAASPASCCCIDDDVDMAQERVFSYLSGRDHELTVHSFKVNLERCGDEKLGIDVDLTADGVLPITDVHEGLVSRWNRLNPKAAISPGDVIVEVNGVKGDVAEMMSYIQDPGVIQLVLIPASALEGMYTYNINERPYLTPRKSGGSFVCASRPPGDDRSTCNQFMCGGTSAASCILPWASPPKLGRQRGPTECVS